MQIWAIGLELQHGGYRIRCQRLRKRIFCTPSDTCQKGQPRTDEVCTPLSEALVTADSVTHIYLATLTVEIVLRRANVDSEGAVA